MIFAIPHWTLGSCTQPAIIASELHTDKVRSGNISRIRGPHPSCRVKFVNESKLTQSTNGSEMPTYLFLPVKKTLEIGM